MPLAVLALLAATLASASVPGPGTSAAPEVSTAPAAARAELEPNPWSLNYGFDRRGRSVGVDYRIRWDFHDLSESPQTLRENIMSPQDTAESVVYGLLSNASVQVYGVRLRPFRAEGAPPAFGGAGAGVATSSAAAAGAAAPSRPRLSLDPFGDLRRNGRREAERFLLREGFNLALPSERGAPGWQKEAVGRGVLDLGRNVTDDEKPFMLPLPSVPAP